MGGKDGLPENVAAHDPHRVHSTTESNGYVESFIGKMRDELLNREILYTLTEARVLIERWRREYNQVRPHSSLNYRPPAPEAIEWPRGATRPGMPTTMAGLT